MLTNNDLDTIADKLTGELDIEKLCDQCVTEYPNGMVEVDFAKLQSLLLELLNGDRMKMKMLTEIMLAMVAKEYSGKPN